MTDFFSSTNPNDVQTLEIKANTSEPVRCLKGMLRYVFGVQLYRTSFSAAFFGGEHKSGSTMYLQGGPRPVRNGVIAIINGFING